MCFGKSNSLTVGISSNDSVFSIMVKKMYCQQRTIQSKNPKAGFPLGGVAQA